MRDTNGQATHHPSISVGLCFTFQKHCIEMHLNMTCRVLVQISFDASHRLLKKQCLIEYSQTACDRGTSAARMLSTILNRSACQVSRVFWSLPLLFKDLASSIAASKRSEGGGVASTTPRTVAKACESLQAS